jgi:hypothetical protein
MTQSPALRLPVELWRIILFEAVATPILPYTDPNRAALRVGLVECIDLFSTSCKIYNEYRGNQFNLTNFRLVCRTWATLLQDFCGLCSVTDLNTILRPSRSKEYLVKSERAQIDEMTILGCKCSSKKASLSPLEVTCVLLQRSEKDKNARYKLIRQDLMSTIIHPRTRILLLSVGYINLDVPLALVPNLLALSLHMNFNFVWTTGISRALRGITHLSLSAVTQEAVEEFPPSMQLENIQFLSLTLLLTSGTRKPSNSIGDWRFPNLHSLWLKGTVEKVFVQSVYDFLDGCGGSISELFLELHLSDIGANNEPVHIFDRWAMFPNLRAFGSEFKILFSDASADFLESTWFNRSSPHPLTLLLSDFFPPPQSSQLQANLIVRRLSAWNVNKIILTETWSTLYDKLTCPSLSWHVHTPDILRKAKQIFDAILLTGIPLYDKTGTKRGGETLMGRFI